ncbi:MAG: prepilin-type N-terminal cleavage/methylation domain-containing protein [Anaerovoracaceae bacterium]
MYNLIQKKKANLKNKKGFTLVEVIVVLVILAILAAILIPSMIGYINKAEEKAIVAEGRSVLLAAQTIASEEYVKNKTAATVNNAKVLELAELTGKTLTDPTVDGGKVKAFTYTSGDYKIECKEGKLGDPAKTK